MIKKLILQRADPFLTKHGGIYYFTASVPAFDCIEIRSSNTIEGLKNAKSRIIWKKHESGVMSEHIWAPEIHFIDGCWYIYFAAGEKDNKWEIRPYVLKCNGSDPMKDEWIELGCMQAADGDNEAFTDFSLDGTVFEHNGERYFIWAQKVGRQMGVSNLYIAKMLSPIKLKTAAVLLSTPEYDWENIDFRVNEGPAVLKVKNKIYITYSASATGAMYCMGMLTADINSDLTDKKSWKKSPVPIFQTDAGKKIFGPGHNSFCTDENNNPICIFHAREYEKIIGDPLYDINRHTFIVDLKSAGFFEL